MQTAEPLSKHQFDQLSEDVCAWGKWDAADERCSLNYLTREHIRAAAGLVRSGGTVRDVTSYCTGIADDDLPRRIGLRRLEPAHAVTIEQLEAAQKAQGVVLGDGETVRSNVEGVDYPVHALKIVATGMACGDSLQFEDLVPICEQAMGREFLFVAAPLRIPGGPAHHGTPSPSSDESIC